jgi:hypothetical protein
VPALIALIAAFVTIEYRPVSPAPDPPDDGPDDPADFRAHGGVGDR